MLKFNKSKPKTLRIDLTVDGLSKNEINVVFRILIDGIEYGFPGRLKETKYVFDFPAFKKVMGENLILGKYPAVIDVTGNGFHIAPWSEDIIIEEDLSASVKDVEGDSSEFISVSLQSIESDDLYEKTTKQENKKDEKLIDDTSQLKNTEDTEINDNKKNDNYSDGDKSSKTFVIKKKKPVFKKFRRDGTVDKNNFKFSKNSVVNKLTEMY